MNDATREWRSKAKTFFNALQLDKPVGHGALADREIREEVRPLAPDLYVARLEGGGGEDVVTQLASAIDFSESAGAYLFSGNRGTGKTTELLRLAKDLEELGCEVFYVDMAEYLNLSQKVEVSDFLISVLGAFSEKVATRLGDDPTERSYFTRIKAFLSADVVAPELKLSLPGVDLKAALSQNPSFKELLQQHCRGHVEALVKNAREFVLEAVNHIRDYRRQPDLKVVLLVDSVERLRGVGDAQDVQGVFKSVETLFSSHADKLRFTGLTTVYTVPPYLQALAGALGSYYAGGRIYALPSIHIYRRRPVVGEAPETEEGDGVGNGLGIMKTIVAARYPGWQEFLAQNDLRMLAENSGGDLRDFFRMIRLALTTAAGRAGPLDGATLKSAQDAVRNDMLPIADDDRQWLAEIMAEHQPCLPSLDQLPRFARLQESKFVLHYRNGEDWYDVHPLLREIVGAPRRG